MPAVTLTALRAVTFSRYGMCMTEANTDPSLFLKTLSRAAIEALAECRTKTKNKLTPVTANHI
jgi:hypothetical protein